MTSLKQKSIETVRWTFLYQLANYSISFVLSIILSRLISPEEFGLTAMLSIFISIANILINSGLSSSLIRYKESSPSDYSTVFYFNILVSLSFYLLLFILAPYISLFYNQPELTLLTRIITLVFVLSSFGLIQNTLLIKELNFKKQTLISFTGLFVSVVIGIYMAYKGFGVYAIVGQTLSQSASITILLWLTSNWRPTGFINLSSLRKLWKFGSYVLFTGVFNAIANNLDNIIIGKVFAPATLGLFVRAKSTRAIPENIFSSVLSTTTFSILSKLNDNPNELRNKHLYFFRLSVFFFIPFTFYFNMISDDLVILLYGEKWKFSIPLLQVISLGILPNMLSAFFSQSLMSFGDSKVTMKLNMLKRTMTLSLLPLGFFLNLEQFVWVFVISQYVGLILDIHFTINKLDTKWLDYLSEMWKPLLVSSFFLFVYILVKQFNLINNHFFQLIIKTLIASSVYIIFAYLLMNETFNNFLELLPLKKLKKK
ncbi:MAG: lipopolysaccharide biosynthesis protein [Flavobacteriales bacterium]|nr:lipopolysaccharide biosynthesis protein [Flavobacteriales bacterium]